MRSIEYRERQRDKEREQRTEMNIWKETDMTLVGVMDLQSYDIFGKYRYASLNDGDIF